MIDPNHPKLRVLLYYETVFGSFTATVCFLGIVIVLVPAILCYIDDSHFESKPSFEESFRNHSSSSALSDTKPYSSCKRRLHSACRQVALPEVVLAIPVAAFVVSVGFKLQSIQGKTYAILQAVQAL